MQYWCQFRRPTYKSRKLQEFRTENDNSRHSLPRHSLPRHCQEPLTLWHPSEFLAKRSVGVTLVPAGFWVLTPSKPYFDRSLPKSTPDYRDYRNCHRTAIFSLWDIGFGSKGTLSDHFDLEVRIKRPSESFDDFNQPASNNLFAIDRLNQIASIPCAMASCLVIGRGWY